jgi:recombination protein RecT
MVEPLPASTVIVARDAGPEIEVFMLRRSARSSFMPDVFVFPGGRVDDADRSPAALQHVIGDTAPLEPAYIYAAARETFEEAGLLFATTAIEHAALHAARRAMSDGTLTFEAALSSLNTSIDADAFTYFSRWITPAVESKRFDARFFVARAPAEQRAEADAYETEDGRWISPANALKHFAAGEFALIFPTIKHLERLADYQSVDALIRFARTKPIVPVMPDVSEERRFALPAGVEGAW